MAEEQTHHNIEARLEMDHDALLEHLRDYNPETGNWKKYMHVEKEDWWWDLGAYVHCGFLIFWCLWCMLVDGYVTSGAVHTEPHHHLLLDSGFRYLLVGRRHHRLHGWEGHGRLSRSRLNRGFAA